MGQHNRNKVYSAEEKEKQSERIKSSRARRKRNIS